MQIVALTLLFITLTVVLYTLTTFLYVKYSNPLLIPMFTTTLSIILVLVLFQVDYDTYMIGGKWIDLLLGPAIVSLAIPLYKQRELLRKHLLPVLGGVIVGSLVGMVSGILFAKLLRFSDVLSLTILPKAITTPIAMEIAAGLGGNPTLAVVFVITAGLTGMMFGHLLLAFGRIDTPLGRGLGLGVASHALGTSKAIDFGEQEASMSSVAMTLSAITGSIFGPLIAWLFQLL
ncbi:LrgB family protein [Sporosarcina sp. 179-K 3D1 HS]|uniref:LrgB family protein n=1 Tax=Sporosarcina sp. 179-K 3D1 HS TaxID=3232169 RepID=UPI0039A03011